MPAPPPDPIDVNPDPEPKPEPDVVLPDSDLPSPDPDVGPPIPDPKPLVIEPPPDFVGKEEPDNPNTVDDRRPNTKRPSSGPDRDACPKLARLPNPTTRKNLSDDLRLDGSSLGEVLDELSTALHTAGFADKYKLYCVGDAGFALVAEFESLEEKKGLPRRKRFGRHDPADVHLFGALHGLLFEVPGYYRLIVIHVSDQPLRFDGTELSEPQRKALLNGGAVDLPSDVLAKTGQWNAHLLVYEYHQEDDGEPIEPATAHKWDSGQHMQGAGLVLR